MVHVPAAAQILERGDVRFFFRPTVQPADAALAPLGVQAFWLVLSPADRARGQRRVRVGKKRLPRRAGERMWARVERVGSFQRVMGDVLEDETYVTKTRGERYQPGARPIAAGSYAFVRHDDHTHLAYRLEDLAPAFELPDELHVAEAGSHIVLFEQLGPARATWTTAGDPARLDREGEELVLVGADDEPEAELGIDLLAS